MAEDITVEKGLEQLRELREKYGEDVAVYYRDIPGEVPTLRGTLADIIHTLEGGRDDQRWTLVVDADAGEIVPVESIECHMCPTIILGYDPGRVEIDPDLRPITEDEDEDEDEDA